jgi:hypothetical protein
MAVWNYENNSLHQTKAWNDQPVGGHHMFDLGAVALKMVDQPFNTYSL